MPCFPHVDTRDARTVVRFIHDILFTIEGAGNLKLFDRVFQDVELMFNGQFGDYRPIDLRYHDFRHTLQASLCMAEILAGRARAKAEPAFTWRQVELGMAAILLHDSGYLKTAADGDGTGAKFTYAHVLRSAAVAASQLPRHGVKRDEIDLVVNAISCTGPESNIDRLPFNNETERLLGCCVTTADYLAQMAAPDYLEQLPHLYREFSESDDYLGIPLDKRPYHSANDLFAQTPGFWENVVKTKLDGEFRGLYRYLSTSNSGDNNAYIDAIERNMAAIREKIADLKPTHG